MTGRLVDSFCRRAGLAAAVLLAAPAAAQLSADACRVTVNGQSVQLNPDGSFTLANVPVGLVRAEIICELDGVTLYGQSEFFEVTDNGLVTIGDVALSPTPPPTLESVVASADTGLLTTMGETTQVRVTGFYSDGTTPEINLMTDGTSYTTSNPEILTVDANGVATAAGNGIALVTATNQGVTSSAAVAVSFGDPGTFVEGFVVDENGAFVPNTTVRIIQFGVPPVMTDGTGFFCLGCVGTPVPSQLGPFFVEAETMIGGVPQYAVSGPFEPVPEGITDAGILTLSPGDFWISDADGNWNDAASWSSGIVPGGGGNATIARPVDITVTHSTGTHDLGNLNCFETLAMSGGLLTAADGSIGLPGRLLQTGGTFGFAGLCDRIDVFNGTFRADGQVDAVQLTLGGGVLTGPGSIDVFGTMDWTGGDVSGIGRLTSNGFLTLNGTTDVNAGTTFENIGTCELQSGNLRIGSSGFTNLTGALFDARGDHSIFNLGGVSAFINQGTFRKSAGTGSTRFTVPFTNGGLVDVQTGDLSLEAPSAHSGTVDIAAGSRLLIGSNATLDAGTSFPGPGLVRIGGGTTTVNSPITMPNLRLVAGAIGGPSELSTPNFAWNNGDVSGISLMRLTGTTTVDGTSDLNGGGRIENEGACSLVSGSLRIGTGTFVNTPGATFDYQGDLGIFSLGGTPVFDNRGTLLKSQGVGSSRITAPLANSGRIDIQTGTLSIEAPVNNTGEVHVEPGSTFFVGSNVLMGAGSTVTGTGQFRVNGGTTAFNAPINVPNLRLSGGTIAGSGTVVTPNFNWTNGDVGAIAQLTLDGVATLNGFADISAGGRVENAAICNLVGGQLRLGNATFVNRTGALFDNQGDFGTFSAGGTTLFENRGTWRKSAGSGAARIGVPFANSGSLDVQSGNVEIEAGMTSTGPISIAAGSSVWLESSSTFDAGASVNGTGELRVVGGTARFDAPVTVARMRLTGGTLAGTSTLVTPDLNWTNGDVGAISLLSLTNTARLAGTTDITANGRVENSGVTTHESGGLRIGNGTFVNLVGGTFDQTGDLDVTSLGGTPSFQNQGTWRKSAGAGTSRFIVPFQNTGTIEVDTGRLHVEAGLANSGPLDVAAGAVLDFRNNATLSPGTTMPGPGRLAIVGGSTSFETPVVVPDLRLLGGELTGSASASTPDFYWSNGDVRGIDSLMLTGIATLDGTNDISSNGGGRGRVENAGALTQQSGQLRIGNGNFVNLPAGVFEVTGDHDVTNLGGTPQFENRGVYRKTAAGANDTRFSVPLVNSGTIDVDAGIVRTDSIVVNSGAIDVAAGASFRTINSVSYDAGSTFPGAGVVRILGGTTTANAAIDVPDLRLDNGVLTGTSVTASTRFRWFGGDVNGLNLLSLTGSSEFNGTLDLSGGSRIENSGTLAHQGGIVRMSSSVLDNAVGGTYDLQGDLSISNNGNGPTLENHGTLIKSAGVGTATVAVPSTNDGTIEVQTGTLAFSGGFTQTAGTTRLAAANARLGTAAVTVLFQGGTLAGVDGSRVISPIDNDGGTILPGEGGTTGTLNTSFAADLQGSGTLAIDLAGTSDHDVLAVGGALTLGGTLDVDLVGGFTPSVGDQFVIATSTSLAGSFASTDLPVGFNWNVDVDTVANTVTLEVLP